MWPIVLSHFLKLNLCKVRGVNRQHTIEALRRECLKRIPKLASAYLESGTGDEELISRNRRQFNSIKFIPKFCLGERNVNTSTIFLGETYSSPIGIAPIGLSGLIRPRAEKYLSRVAAKNNIPYCLSTVSTTTPEDLNQSGILHPKNKWFQLYPPKDLNILSSLIERAKENDFSTLVITIDIPAPSRRERSKHAGLNVPIRINWRLILDALLHPQWAMETIVNGLPRLKTVESYTNNNNLNFVSKFVGNRLGGSVDWDYVKSIRSHWNGSLVIKGVLHEQDAITAKKLGCDAIYVSNHGGRQFDGAVSPLRQLTKIRKALGPDFPLIYDSGIRSGLNIMKAIYAGADFVFIGRPFMYGVGAFKEKGAQQAFDILDDQLRNNMMQMGLLSIEEIKKIPPDQVEIMINKI